jgi:hypothetical protein
VRVKTTTMKMARKPVKAHGLNFGTLLVWEKTKRNVYE